MRTGLAVAIARGSGPRQRIWYGACPLMSPAAMTDLDLGETQMTKTVADVMTRDLLTVTPETPLPEAIQLLAKNRISGLPVVTTDGQLTGGLSEADLMWQGTGAPLPADIMLLDSVIYLENPARYNEEVHKALGQTVAEVMGHEKVCTTHPEASLKEAAQLMHHKKVTRLPVLDQQGTLVGILTQGDIVRALAESYQDASADMAG